MHTFVHQKGIQQTPFAEHSAKAVCTFQVKHNTSWLLIKQNKYEYYGK